MHFLAYFHTSVSNGEFDEDIVNFLANEVDIANQRKKEATERRRLKKQEERERKVEMARQRTLAAVEPLLNRELIPNISLYEQL